MFQYFCMGGPRQPKVECRVSSPTGRGPLPDAHDPSCYIIYLLVARQPRIASSNLMVKVLPCSPVASTAAFFFLLNNTEGPSYFCPDPRILMKNDPPLTLFSVYFSIPEFLHYVHTNDYAILTRDLSFKCIKHISFHCVSHQRDVKLK